MTIVQQLTPFTCGLACIESVCIDLGKPKRQEDILRDFKGHLIGDVPKIEQFGATSDPLIIHILEQQGFTVSYWKDHRPEVQHETFEPLDHAKQAILVSAHFNLNTFHCVRFAGMNQGDTIFAMEPTFGGPISRNIVSRI